MNLTNLVTKWAAEVAFREYLALPDAATIASRMVLVDAAWKATLQIQEANRQAWIIRLELAKSWKEGVLPVVMKMVKEHVGELPFSVEESHILTGPLKKAMYPHGISVQMYRDMEKRLQKEAEEAKKKKAEDSKKAREERGRQGTKRREHKLLVQNVRAYIAWVKKEGKLIGLQSADEFPNTAGINRKRFAEYLRTLINGMVNAQGAELICETLHGVTTIRRKRRKGRRGAEPDPDEEPIEEALKPFEHVTIPAVAESLKILGAKKKRAK